MKERNLVVSLIFFTLAVIFFYFLSNTIVITRPFRLLIYFPLYLGFSNFFYFQEKKTGKKTPNKKRFTNSFYFAALFSVIAFFF